MLVRRSAYPLANAVIKKSPDYPRVKVRWESQALTNLTVQASCNLSGCGSVTNKGYVIRSLRPILFYFSSLFHLACRYCPPVAWNSPCKRWISAPHFRAAIWLKRLHLKPILPHTVLYDPPLVNYKVLEILVQ
jgi:hypothetical protein